MLVEVSNGSVVDTSNVRHTWYEDCKWKIMYNEEANHTIHLNKAEYKIFWAALVEEQGIERLGESCNCYNK